MQKCILHDSVRYRNTHSRDPITLLSMDIGVETFLEIGVSDLLVLTQHLQDLLHMEVWETYLSLSIGLGKQNFMISHDILLIISVVEWLTSGITHLCVYQLVILSSKKVYCHCYNLILSPTSHELGDALLLQCRSTLFLLECNTLPLHKFNYLHCWFVISVIKFLQTKSTDFGLITKTSSSEFCCCTRLTKKRPNIWIIVATTQS